MKRIYLISLVCGLCPWLVMEFWRYIHPVSSPVVNFIIELFIFFIPVAIICLWVRYSKARWGILRVIVTYVLLLFFVIYIGLLGNRYYKKHTVLPAISRPLWAIVQVETSIPEISEASIIWSLPEKDLIGCRIVLQKLKKGILQTQSGDNPVTIKKSGCTSKLPPQFFGIDKGLGLSDAYVINMSGVYIVYTGSLSALPHDEVCHSLISLFATKFPSSKNECRFPIKNTNASNIR